MSGLPTVANGLFLLRAVHPCVRSQPCTCTLAKVYYSPVGQSSVHNDADADVMYISKAKFGTGTLPESAEATLGFSPLDPVDLGSNHEPLAASMMLNH